MAIYNAGYLSPIRKKLGNAVGRKWRTLDVLAVYQPFVSNPNTGAQQMVRARFGVAASLAMSFAAAVKLGFANICEGTKVPERSMFIKKNWNNIHADSPGSSIAVTYPDLVIAKGPLPEAVVGTPSCTDPLQIDATITDNTGAQGTSANDKVYMVAYSPEAQQSVMSDGRNTRAGETISLTVPATWNGHRVHVWAFTIGAGNNNMGVISNSRYLGSVTIS